MAEPFLRLSPDDRREALAVAAAASGRPVHLLDKDVWLVWLLDVLFRAPFGDHLVFKGGSSLSKGYQIISRFSEDVDLTYHIRVLAPDLAGTGLDPLPPSRSQEKRWTKEIRTLLPVWIDKDVLPRISDALGSQGLTAMLSMDGEKVFFECAPLAAGSGYVRPVVMLEFGARSTGEPWEPRLIGCDAAPSVAGVSFPSATARVMRPERTFWEKATAIHVFCEQGEFRGGERFARHWHDLTRLDRAGCQRGSSGPFAGARRRQAQVHVFLGEEIALFRSLFRGREDVYARRWESPDGRAGYSPNTERDWKAYYAAKPEDRKRVDKETRKSIPLDDDEIHAHLAGKHTLGVYPLLRDESCWFLAVDFDKKTWTEDTAAFWETCKSLGVPASVECSRSGNGAHVWIFFERPVPATVARRLGALLLTRTMERRHQLGLDSYDRFFPNQDTMPKGGFGTEEAMMARMSDEPV